MNNCKKKGRKEGGCQSERSRGHEMKQRSKEAKKQRRKDVRPSQGAERS